VPPAVIKELGSGPRWIVVRWVWGRIH